MEQEYGTFDYNRVISVSACAPSFGRAENFVIPPAVNTLKSYGEHKYGELTREREEEIEEKLEEHKGLTVVSEKENEIHKELTR